MTRNPPGTPDPRFLNEVAALAHFPAVLDSNAAYMRGELDNLDCSTDQKARIDDLCGELSSLAYDLRTEARNIEDKLGLRPGKEPWDSDIVNPDPRVTLAFFRNWPIEVINKMNDLVRLLEGGAALAYVLVAESGTNVLGAYTSSLDALDRIEALLVEHENATNDRQQW